MDTQELYQREFETKELQQKLKEQEKDNVVLVRLLETEREIIEEQLLEQIATKESELRSSRFISRISITMVAICVFFCTTAFVSPFRGMLCPDRQVNNSEGHYKKSNTDSPLKQITKQVQQQQIESTIASGVEQLTQQTDAEKDLLHPEERNEWEPQYEATLAQLKLERLNPNAPVSTEVSRQLEELEQAREKLFRETDYTFYDWYFKGVTEKERSDCRNAIGSLTRALSLNPRSATAYSYRGYCYCNLKQYSNAIADLSKAIELDPGDAVVYYNRGGGFYYLKQFEMAAANYTEALKINPYDSDTYYNRGTCYFNLNNFDQALADYTKAIELNPGDADSYYSRGVVYKTINQSEKAGGDFANARALNSQHNYP